MACIVCKGAHDGRFVKPNLGGCMASQALQISACLAKETGHAASWAWGQLLFPLLQALFCLSYSTDDQKCKHVSTSIDDGEYLGSFPMFADLYIARWLHVPCVIHLYHIPQRFHTPNIWYIFYVNLVRPSSLGRLLHVKHQPAVLIYRKTFEILA